MAAEEPPLRFTEEAVWVLTRLEALIERAEQIKALREVKGKGLGVEATGLLAQVDGARARLRAVLTAATGETDSETQTWLSAMAARMRER